MNMSLNKFVGLHFYKKYARKVHLVFVLFQIIHLSNIYSTVSLVSSTSTSNSFIVRTQQNKLKYHDIWYEINDSIILNCSLRVGKDQHIVWHRKYEKMGVHVLTIGSETFISDLRIRPIKEHFNKNNELMSRDQTQSSEIMDTFESQIYTNTWNLEIRRLRKDDTALYYCVLNSENSYGQIYRLNVLPHLKLVNNTEIYLNNSEFSHVQNEQFNLNAKHAVANTFTLVCKFDDALTNPNDQIKWYFNKFRIKSTIDPTNDGLIKKEHVETTKNQLHSTTSLTSNHHFVIVQKVSFDTNTTLSILNIQNFNSKYNTGKYKCQYKGLSRTVRVYPNTRNETLNKIVYKQSIFSLSSASSSSSSTLSSSPKFAKKIITNNTCTLFILIYLNIVSLWLN